MPLMLTFLLGLLATSSALPGVTRVTLQEAAEQVSQCGLGPVTAHYEPEVEEDILVAKSAQLVTDDQLACAFNVVGFYYTLALPPDVQTRFDKMLHETATKLAKARAREWLSDRGLLHRVPDYQDGVTDDRVFTSKIERLCGPQAKGAFQSKYGFHILSPEWTNKLGFSLNSKRMETLDCLLNTTAFAGFKIGFIGNEAQIPTK